MKKLLNMLPTALVAILFVACTNEDLPDSEPIV